MTKQRVLFRGIAVCLSHFSYYYYYTLFSSSSSLSVTSFFSPSFSGWITCWSGEEEDGVLQQQSVREKDQQCF